MKTGKSAWDLTIQNANIKYDSSKSWKDGKWHHIAATFETVNQNYTSVKFYYDYRLVAEDSDFWGALRRKLIDTEVRVGGAVKGEIDEVRISRGALAVEDFLRLRCQGFQIILR